MADIRPKDLPVAGTVNPTTGAFVVDDGVNVQRTNATDLVNAAVPLASQTEAEAGVSNATRTSPLRVKQYVDTLDITGNLAGKEPLIAPGTTAQYYRGDKTFQTLDKSSVGLANVANTAPADLPVSTATQTALNGKEPTVAAGTTAQYYRGDKSWQTLNKAAVGLANVDNTADASKPVSTAQQTAIDATTTFSQAASYPAGSVRKKLQRIIDVDDAPYNADPTGVANSYAAFAAAITALPATGGTIAAKGASYRLDTAPTWGTKNIIWDIGPNTIFTGAGTGFGNFPVMGTNLAQQAVGPWIQSRTMQKATHANGGVSAFSVEMLQPDSYGAGQSVGIYAGSISANPDVAGNNWAINALTYAAAGAGGTFQGIEVDANSDSASATVIGIQITGDGTEDADTALLISRASQKWNLGVFIDKVADGALILPNAGGRGVVVGAPGAQPVAVGDTAISARQMLNSADTILLQRLTDSSPTGQFIRAVNAANSQNIYTLGVDGSVSQAGSLTVGPSITSGTGVSTGSAAIELGGARTGDGSSLIDFHSTPGTDFEARIVRYSGANGGMDFNQTGTGGVTFVVGGGNRLSISPTLVSLANPTGLLIARTAVTAPAASDGNVFSGIYTPTLTSVANVSASAPYPCQYMRVGSMVTVSGKIDLTSTAAAVTQLGISLPIASNFSSSEHCGGTAAEVSTTTSNPGAVLGDITNDRANLHMLASNTSIHAVYFQFTYRII